MIRSYGVHWRADRVNWGKQGPNNRGTLLGAASKSARAISVDFRRQRGIYALYADYELVYVGQTGSGSDRLFKRLKAHRFDHLSERWNRFSWFGTQWVTQQHKLSMDTAALHEAVEAGLNIMEAVSIAMPNHGSIFNAEGGAMLQSISSIGSVPRKRKRLKMTSKPDIAHPTPNPSIERTHNGSLLQAFISFWALRSRPLCAAHVKR